MSVMYQVTDYQGDMFRVSDSIGVASSSLVVQIQGTDFVQESFSILSTLLEVRQVEQLRDELSAWLQERGF